MKTFLDFLNGFDLGQARSLVKNTEPGEVRAVLEKERSGFSDYLRLLSPAASELLEEVAARAHRLTVKHFGRTILLYTPLYLSNECDNNCVYCGFSRRLPEKRITLSAEEVRHEAEYLYQRGFRHLLLVSGEKRDRVTIGYLGEIIGLLHQRFSSLGLEIFPLRQSEYRELFRAGADGLTLYQEVYNPEIYKLVHPRGPKSDYRFRILAPERAARAGFYRVNIGVLLGLGRWKEEAVLLGLHAAYLKKRFWRTQVAVSFPRLKKSAAGFQPLNPVSDRMLVQMICALRIFLPTAPLVLSTRETASLRNNLLPLGITQLSAESRTSPGAYALSAGAEEQFEVSDQRRLAEVDRALRERGYEPVYKDWDRAFIPGGERAGGVACGSG